jgi:hypothetical protein
VIAGEVRALSPETFAFGINRRDLRVAGRAAELVGVPLAQIIGPAAARFIDLAERIEDLGCSDGWSENWPGEIVPANCDAHPVSRI